MIVKMRVSAEAIIGTSNNQLTLLEVVGKDKHGSKLGKFECTCSKIKILTICEVFSGHVKSCGCLQSRNYLTSKEKFLSIFLWQEGRTLEEIAEQLGRSVAGVYGSLKKQGIDTSREREIEDLTDQKFGRLTVKKFSHKKGKRIFWLCQCDYGNDVIRRSDSLNHTKRISCGCWKTEIVKENSQKPEYKEKLRQKMLGRDAFWAKGIKKDLTDAVFGKLTVKYWVKQIKGRNYWLAECECGVEIIVRSDSLRKRKSYGCTKNTEFRKTKTYKEKMRKAQTGLKKSRERKYSCNDLFFTQIDSEEKAYWLGFITADGCVTDSSMLIIGLARKDEEHLQKFLIDLNSTNPILRGNDKVSDHSSVRIFSKQLANDLKLLGVEPRKTFTVAPCIQVPKSLLQHYWRGVIDGDGWIFGANGGKDIGIGLCGNLSIVTGFRDFIKELLGLNANVKKCSSIYRVTYNGLRKSRDVAKLLYSESNVFLERKMVLASGRGMLI